MALETMLSYAIALALPLWLMIEELTHRSAAAPARARRRAEARPQSEANSAWA